MVLLQRHYFLGGTFMEQELRTLLLRHERRIHFQIHRLNIRNEQYDDFYAEGMIALWKALEDYDESQGEIGTFLNHRIRFRLIDYQRTIIRHIEKDKEAMESQIIAKDSGNTVGTTNQMLICVTGGQLKDETFWHDIQSELSGNQWKWIRHFVIDGLSIKEIMELENVSESAVKSWAREARRKLRTEVFHRKIVEAVGG